MSTLKARTLVAIRPALVAAAVIAAAGTASAQSGLQYAIVQNAYGSVVGQLSGGGSTPATSATVTLQTSTGAMIYNPVTGTLSPAPAGTKIVPLYVVTNAAGATPGKLVGMKPPITCPHGQLPTLALPSSGPKSVHAASSWRCAAGL